MFASIRSHERPSCRVTMDMRCRDERMQQRVATFIVSACVLKFCKPNMISNLREHGACERDIGELIGRLLGPGCLRRTAAGKGGCHIPPMAKASAPVAGSGRFAPGLLR